MNSALDGTILRWTARRAVGRETTMEEERRLDSKRASVEVSGHLGLRADPPAKWEECVRAGEGLLFSASAQRLGGAAA